MWISPMVYALPLARHAHELTGLHGVPGEPDCHPIVLGDHVLDLHAGVGQAA